MSTIASADFLLELGVEEMPSAPLNKAKVQFKSLVEKALDKEGLPHGAVEIFSTPRRLTAYVHDVATATQEVNEKTRGPKTSIAFAEDGTPKPAALGFAKKFGLTVEELDQESDEQGNTYLVANIHTPSRETLPLLSSLATSLIAQIAWPRSQRWGSEHAKFVRPIRWIVALLGSEVVPVSYADVTSSNITRGHRVLGPGAHVIAEPAAYKEVLRAAGVLLEDEREAVIRAGIKAIEDERGGAHVDTPQRIFDEVINLTEYPRVLVGTFDEEFLSVPHEIICDSMLSNQRYFPIYDKDGALTREFVIVSNTAASNDERVIDGNERVVRARLDDAKFFFEEDLKHPLEFFVDKLKTVVFQEKLGTVRQKTARVEALAPAVADALYAAHAAGTPAELVADATRAAHLAKADLVSQAVVEFTSQQGVMGGYYATAAGEKPVVAEAITQHYRPRFSGDEIPASNVGAVVALADKLDTICGIFAIDEPPTGSSDPYAVRRAALGVLAIFEAYKGEGLDTLIATSLKLYADQGISFDEKTVAERVHDFFLGRLESIAKDAGIAPEVINAIATSAGIDASSYLARAHALHDAREKEPELFEDLSIAFARAAHLSDTTLGIEVDTALLGTSEQNLFDACESARANVPAALADKAYDQAFTILANLREPIDTFFADVLVMDEDIVKRNNRLRLLNRFTEIFANVADMSQLSHKK